MVKNLGASLVILSYDLASRKTALFCFSFTLTLVQLFFLALAPPVFFPGRAPALVDFPLSPLASLPLGSAFLAYNHQREGVNNLFQRVENALARVRNEMRIGLSRHLPYLNMTYAITY